MRCAERYDGRVEVHPVTGVQAAVAAADYELAWPGGAGVPTSVTSRATLALDADPEAFDVTVHLAVGQDGEPVAERTWHRTIPRRLA